LYVDVSYILSHGHGIETPTVMEANPRLPNETRLNVVALITRFGGRSELWRKLTKRGNRLSIESLEKWRERGRIPSPHLMTLLAMAKEEGKPINLYDYIITDTQKYGIEHKELIASAIKGAAGDTEEISGKTKASASRN
jgi:hypothetical protein